MWAEMIKTAELADELGDSLALGCQKHEVSAVAKSPCDFRTNAPLGRYLYIYMYIGVVQNVCLKHDMISLLL